MNGMPSPLRITDPFWLAWQQAVIHSSLPHQWRMCEETGRFENFRRAARGEQEGYEGYVYNDSDVYKLLEACASAMALDEGFTLRGEVMAMAKTIAAAQAEDGYLHTFHQLGRMTERYQGTVGRHELYCMGHLIEAACAFHERGIETPLWGAALRAADHVCGAFGEGKLDKIPGHQEIELALARLADAAQDHKLRRMARWFIRRRGQAPHRFAEEFESVEFPGLVNNYRSLVLAEDGSYDGRYLQDAVPLEEMTEPHGHAVRLMYFLCGALDAGGYAHCPSPDEVEITAAIEMAEIAQQASQRVLQAIEEGFLYATGAIGSSGANEGFTTAHDLPNEDAYAETCAAIGLIMLAQRLNRADLFDLALHNAALSGISLDGLSFFYDNPLAAGAEKRRQEWFGCACCPPNIARLLLSLDRRAPIFIRDGHAVALSWMGVRAESAEGWFESEVRRGAEAGLTMRGAGLKAAAIHIPAWAEDPRAFLNGEPIELAEGGLGVSIDLPEGAWEIEIKAAAPPRLLPPHPLVASQQGRAVIRQGPFIYCLEEADLGRPVEDFELDVSQALEWSEEPAPGLEGRTHGSVWAAGTDGSRARFVPCFAWANRAPGSMAVWVRAKG
jgi:DUF1680 family protein